MWKSHQQAGWKVLDGEFDIALFGMGRDWITARVAHRSRMHGFGSWRLAWSRVEHRFARSSELLQMQTKRPELDVKVAAFIQSALQAALRSPA